MIRALAAMLAFLLLTGIGPFRFGEQAARKHLEEAQILIKDNEIDEAIPMLRGLRVRYPDTDATYEGTALLGVILLEQGDAQGALNAAKGVLGNEEAPAKALNTARLVAGLAYYELGESSKAVDHLEPLYKKVYTRADVQRMSEAMTEIYRDIAQPYDQARWQARLISVSVDQKGEALSAELEDIILNQLTPGELESLLGMVGQAYPADYVQFAIAKAHFRSGEFDLSGSELDRFLGENPGHPLTEQAILLKQRAEHHDAMVPTRIGVLLPLSGRFGGPGQAVKRGMDLALQQVGDVGWSGQKLEIIYRDTQAEGADISKLLHDLVLRDNVVAVIGPLLSNHAEAAAEAAQALEIPLLALNQKHGIPDTGDFIFRAYPSAEVQLAQLAQYAHDKMGIKRLGILYPESRYGSWTAHQLWDEAENNEIVVTAVEMYQPGLENYVPVARKLSGKFYAEPRSDEYKALKYNRKHDDNPKNDNEPVELPPIVDYDALFIADSHKSLVLLAPALAFVEIPVGRFKTDKRQKSVRLLGGNTWNHPDLGRLGGQYVVGSIFISEYFKYSKTEAAQGFLKSYKAAYNGGPNTFAAHGFDAIGLLHAVISAEKPSTRLDVQNTLANMEFDGVTGHYQFDDVGELQKESFILTVTRKGHIMQVYPELPAPEKK